MDKYKKNDHFNHSLIK